MAMSVHENFLDDLDQDVLDVRTETTETLDDVSSTNGSQKAKAKAAAKKAAGKRKHGQGYTTNSDDSADDAGPPGTKKCRGPCKKRKLIATHFQRKQTVCSECRATDRTFKSIYSNSTAEDHHWFNTLDAKSRTKVLKQIDARKKEAGPRSKITFTLGQMKAFITVESGVRPLTRPVSYLVFCCPCHIESRIDDAVGAGQFLGSFGFGRVGYSNQYNGASR